MDKRKLCDEAESLREVRLFEAIPPTEWIIRSNSDFDFRKLPHCETEKNVW